MPNPSVLVVEDQSLLRMAAIDMLEEAGFEVAGASTAEIALTIMESYPSIRVVFTDVDLGPGQDGLWLSFRIRDGWPPVGLIVTSGHGHVTQDLVPEGATFFRKPYFEEQIIDQVRRLAA